MRELAKDKLTNAKATKYQDFNIVTLKDILLSSVEERLMKPILT